MYLRVTCRRPVIQVWSYVGVVTMEFCALKGELTTGLLIVGWIIKTNWNVISEVTLHCKNEVQKVGRKATLSATLSAETKWDIVFWKLRDRKNGDWETLEECNQECETQGLELQHTTDTLIDSGVFEFFVAINGDHFSNCSGTLAVFSKLRT